MRAAHGGHDVAARSALGRHASAADAERLLGLVRLTADKQVFSANLASPAENMSSWRKLLLGGLVVGPALAFFAFAANMAVQGAGTGNPTSIVPRVVGALLVMLTVAAVMQLAVPPRVVVGSDGVPEGACEGGSCLRRRERVTA